MGCAGGGIILPPDRGKENESKFGFTIGDRVRIVNDSMFNGWHGHIRCFDNCSPALVAVDLDEPPEGHKSNGQWFNFSNIILDPK